MSHTLDWLRIAVRSLRAAPTFSVTALITLSLAVAAVTTTFSVTRPILIEPLPYAESERLVEVGYRVPGYGFNELPFSVGTFDHTRREQRSLSEFAIYYDADRYNVGLEDPERVPVARVTPGFFAVFLAPPAPGRPFQESDERPDAEPVVIVSHDLWQRRWGGDPDLVGRTIHVEGVDRQVVGIAREGFSYPDRHTGLWIPFTIDPGNLMPMSFGYPGVGRLAPGVTVASADADIARITNQLTGVFPDRLTTTWAERGQFQSYVRPLLDKVVGNVRTEAWLVFGTATLLLLLAVANVANLFLVRVEGRTREMALRQALGAGKLRLLMPGLGESLVLAAAAGVLGLAVASALVALALRVAPPDLPRVDEMGMTAGAVFFGLAVALAAGATFGLLPFLTQRGASIQTALQAGGRSLTGSKRTRRLQHVLVGGQVALATALMVGAGLLIQTFRNLASVDPGFDAEGVLTFEIGLPAPEYDAEARSRMWQQLRDRFEDVADVEAVGGAAFLPLSTDFRKGPLYVEGDEPPAGESGPVVDLKNVTPGYFAAMGIPLREGRVFQRSDGPGGFPAVIVNQTLVDRHLDGGPALGRRIKVTERGDYAVIVGVVGSVHTESFSRDPLPYLYFPPGTTTPVTPDAPASMTFAVRTPAPADRVVPPLAEALAEIDPKLPMGSLRSLHSIVDEHLARERLIAWVLLAMAVTGVVLASVGVYGVIAYVALRRRREVAVRMALGAPPSGVVLRFAGRALVVVAAGAVVGALAAFLGGRALESILYGVAGTDVLVYALAVTLVVGTGLAASFVPAWRASRLDPSGVLREE